MMRSGKDEPEKEPGEGFLARRAAKTSPFEPLSLTIKDVLLAHCHLVKERSASYYLHA